MFGHHSGSGSIGTLTVLAAVALGALLTPLDCAIARAQPVDLALGLKSETFALFQATRTDAWERHDSQQFSPGAQHAVSVRSQLS